MTRNFIPKFGCNMKSFDGEGVRTIDKFNGVN